MGAPDNFHARQAALLLHGLPSGARQKVFAKLDAVELSRVTPLLDELTQLGISQSLSAQLQHLTSTSAAAADTQPLSVHEQVQRLNAEDIARCTGSCAPVTLARFLQAADWPWKAQVLDLLPALRRAKVLDCMRREYPPLAPAVLKALCRRLCQHVAQVSENKSVVVPCSDSHEKIRTGFRSLLKWTR